MLERGARSEAIRAFENASSEWAIRSKRCVGDRRATPQARIGAERRQRPEKH
jgi:hypothetical protein